MTEEQTTLYDATEAGTIATLAERAAKVDVHVIDVKDAAGRETIARHVYGRGSGGELTTVDTIDLAQAQRDHARRGPDRLADTVQLHTPATLVEYANRHLRADRGTLWGDVDNARLTVILNDHGVTVDEDDPDWGDHRAVLSLKHSPEWQAWTSHDEKGMSQEELAEFLEEHLVEVIDPDGSTLLEVTRTFQATTGATFRRAQSLHSGLVQITWQEDGEAKAGSSGQLGFRLLNLDEVRRDAVESILSEVADQLSLTAFEGTAPSPRR